MAIPPPTSAYLISKAEGDEAVTENRLSWAGADPVWSGGEILENFDANQFDGGSLLDDGTCPDWAEIKSTFQGPEGTPDTPTLTDQSFCQDPPGDWIERVQVDFLSNNDPKSDNVQIWRAPDVSGSPGTFTKIATVTLASLPYQDNGAKVAGDKYYYKGKNERHIDDAGAPVESAFGSNTSLTLMAADPTCGPA